MTRQALWPPFRQDASVSVALRVVAAIVLLLVIGAAVYELQVSRKAVIADTERQMSRLAMVFAEQTSRAVEAVDLVVMGVQETLARQPQMDEARETLRHRIRGVRQLAAFVALPGGSRCRAVDQRPIPGQ